MGITTITVDTTDVKRLIREYYNHLYTHKFDNLSKIDQFYKKYKLPQLNQYEINNLSSTVTTDKIEFIVLIFLPKWFHWRTQPSI